jgi:hypothetical protein
MDVRGYVKNGNYDHDDRENEKPYYKWVLLLSGVGIIYFLTGRFRDFDIYPM